MWYSSETIGEKPSSLDLTSSKVYNYMRKDFVSSPVVDPDTGETTETLRWTYMEQKIPKDQYELYVQTQQQQADLDYIAMMADVDL